MFDGALGKAPGSRGRVWVGAVISVGAHAAVLAAALFISTGPEPEVVKEPDFDHPVVIPMERVARGSREVRPAAAPRPKAKPRPTPRAPTVVTRPAEIEPPPPDTNVTDTDEPIPGGLITGVQLPPLGHEKGTCEGPDCIKTVPESAQVGEAVGVFDSHMTPPVFLGGEQAEYTREALEARVQGTMVVKCVVTVAGTLESCRVLKPLPFMEAEVLRSLATRRYQPVTLNGQPIPVEYVFNIRLRMP